MKNIRRQFWIAVCSALFVCGSTATAQEQEPYRGMPDRMEEHYKPMPLSPEKSARLITDRMDSLLNLTEKQYNKLYKLHLKWAREDMENKPAAAPRMGGRPGGRPGGAPGFGGGGMGPGPRGGNRPPEGMDRRAPRDFSPSGDRETMEKQQAKLEKQRKKREKKLKKVLSDEQYARWCEELRPAAPEGGPESGREDKDSRK